MTWRGSRMGAAMLVAVSAWADDAAACDCLPRRTPCQAVSEVDAVFAGTVVSVKYIEAIDPWGSPSTHAVVRLNVERAFLNSTVGFSELIGPAFSICTYHFSVGKRYLVYASKTADSRLTTNTCTRTKPLSEAGEDLQYLTSLPDRGTGVRVTGRVNEWGRHPAEERGADYGPLKGLVVSVRGATFSTDLVTDERGTYELLAVPTGKLTIAVAAPPGLGADVAAEFEAKNPGGCIQANVTFAAEAVVTGSVQDLNGRPLGGITVDAVAEELAGFQPPAYQSPVTTDEYGAFRFERLPPGRYVFGVNLTTQRGKPPSGPPIFFPGTSSVQGAAVVDLKPGDRKDIGVVRLTVHSLSPSMAIAEVYRQ